MDGSDPPCHAPTGKSTGPEELWLSSLLDELRRFAARTNRLEAADIAAETVFRLLSKARSLVGTVDGRRWAFDTARNLLVDKLRREKQMVLVPIEEVDLACWQPPCDEDLRERDRAARLDRDLVLQHLLPRLSKGDVAVLICRMGGFDSEHDIAPTLGISPRTVRKRSRDIDLKARMVRQELVEDGILRTPGVVPVGRKRVRFRHQDSLGLSKETPR